MLPSFREWDLLKRVKSQRKCDGDVPQIKAITP